MDNQQNQDNDDSLAPAELAMVERFEGFLSKDPEAFLREGEVVYQVTQKEMLAFADSLRKGTNFGACGPRISPLPPAAAEEWMDTLRELISDYRKATYEFGLRQLPSDNDLMMTRQKQIFAHVRALTEPRWWNDILEAVSREVKSKRRIHTRDDGNAPGHSHSIPGHWDSDNAELAGMPCAWCLLWNQANAVIGNQSKSD